MCARTYEPLRLQFRVQLPIERYPLALTPRRYEEMLDVLELRGGRELERLANELLDDRLHRTCFDAHSRPAVPFGRGVLDAYFALLGATAPHVRCCRCTSLKQLALDWSAVAATFGCAGDAQHTAIVPLEMASGDSESLFCTLVFQRGGGIHVYDPSQGPAVRVAVALEDGGASTSHLLDVARGLHSLLFPGDAGQPAPRPPARYVTLGEWECSGVLACEVAKRVVCAPRVPRVDEAPPRVTHAARYKLRVAYELLRDRLLFE